MSNMPPQPTKSKAPPPSDTTYIQPYDARAIPTEELLPRSRTSVINSSTTGLLTGQEKRIIFGCEWFFKPEGVDHIEKNFRNAMESLKLHTILKWDSDNYVWVAMSLGNVDKVSGELHRIITSTITNEHLDDYISDDEEEHGDMTTYDDSDGEEAQHVSRLIIRLSVWKRKNNHPENDSPRRLPAQKVDIIEEEKDTEEYTTDSDISGSASGSMMFPPVSNVSRFKDSLEYNANEELISDQNLSEVSKLTGTECMKILNLRRVFVKATAVENLKRAMRKLESIRKSSKLKSKHIDHIFYTEGLHNVNFQIKYFVEVNQPPQVSSDFNNAAHLRYFHTTLLDNLSLCPTHDYGNLSQSLAIRRVEWDPQKTLYLPSKISKIHPATESKNVEVASKLWGRHRFRRMGKEDENPIKQVANDNKSHVQQATDEAQTSARNPRPDYSSPAAANANAVMGWAAEIPHTGADQYLKSMPVERLNPTEVMNDLKAGPTRGDQAKRPKPAWDSYEEFAESSVLNTREKLRRGGHLEILKPVFETDDRPKSSQSQSPLPNTPLQGLQTHALRGRSGAVRASTKAIPKEYAIAMGLVSSAEGEDPDSDQAYPIEDQDLAIYPPDQNPRQDIAFQGASGSSTTLVGAENNLLESDLQGLDFSPRDRTLIDDDIYFSNDNASALAPALEPTRLFNAPMPTIQPLRSMSNPAFADRLAQLANHVKPTIQLNQRNTTDEVLQGNDEVSARRFFNTMNHRAPKPVVRTLKGSKVSAHSGLELPSPPLPRQAPPKGQSARDKAVDPLPEFLKEINLSFEELIRDLRSFRGELQVRAEFGRIILKGVHRKFVSKGHSIKNHTKDDLLEILDPNENYVTSNTLFTNVLTTVPSDIQYLIDLQTKSGGRLWEVQNEEPWSVVYEFVGHEKGILGYQPFSIEIDGERDTKDIKIKTKKDLGYLYVHGTKRQWDFRLAAIGSKISNDLDHRYNHFAEAIGRYLYIEPELKAPDLAFRIDNELLGDGRLVLDGVRVHRIMQHKSMDGASMLHVSEIHDLDVNSQMGASHTVFHAVAHTAPRPGYDKVDFWHEVSISSVKADEEFKKNVELDLGDEADWTHESLSQLQCARAMYLPACEMLKKMDGVGFWNDNGVDVSKALLPEDSQQKAVDYKFW